MGQGRGLGRCDEQDYDPTEWRWPWSDKILFWLRECGAFGSFGSGKVAMQKLKDSLEATGGPGAPVHFDSECEHAFAVQVMGSKFYWLQGPNPEEDPKSRATFVADFYAHHKMKQIPTPSDNQMLDYVTVL